MTRDRDGDRPAEPRGPHRLRHRLALDPARRAAARHHGVLRVKDEARRLPWVLPPLLRACDHVLLVDNGSTDGTPEVAAETAAKARARATSSRQTSYPFSVARAGAEHLAQPELSVHSLSYFYNWCFAQVQHPLLLEVGRRHGADHRGRGVDRRPRLAGRRRPVDHPGAAARALPRERAARATSTSGLRNAEEWGFPIGPDFVFTKAFEWEIRTTPDAVRSIGLPHGLCVELKYLDGDEFAHWTDPASFATSLPQQAQAPRVGRSSTPSRRASCLPGVHEISAPEGVHIVDYVTQRVAAARPAAPRGRLTSPPRTSASFLTVCAGCNAHEGSEHPVDRVFRPPAASHLSHRGERNVGYVTWCGSRRAEDTAVPSG